MFAHVIGEDVELITRLIPDLGLVMADQSQMHQILMNLVVNARDAMPGGGRVTVETRNVVADAANPYVYLGVTDTGTGMSDEVKKHLYEPFFTTKDKGKARDVGSLRCTASSIKPGDASRSRVNSARGRPSTFTCRSSSLVCRSNPTLILLSAPALRGTETVLLVEDQDAVRELATTILETYGYCVLQASN